MHYFSNYNLQIMKKSLLFIASIVLTIGAQAQSVGPATINAAGGSGTAGGNNFDYSIAEMTVVSTATTTDKVFTQGVLQPHQLIADAVSDATLLSQNFSIFPNPANTFLNIKSTNIDNTLGDITLLDATGKTVYKINNPVLNNGVFVIDMQAYPMGNYILNIADKNYKHAVKVTKVN